MKVKVTRVQMAGITANSYDVLVPADHVPNHVNPHYFVSQGGKDYVPFTMATVSKEHSAMPLGSARYNDWLQHEKRAKKAMLEIIQKAFPETANLTEFPTLWVPGTDYEDKVKYLKIRDGSF